MSASNAGTSNTASNGASTTTTTAPPTNSPLPSMASSTGSGANNANNGTTTTGNTNTGGRPSLQHPHLPSHLAPLAPLEPSAERQHAYNMAQSAGRRGSTDPLLHASLAASAAANSSGPAGEASSTPASAQMSSPGTFTAPNQGPRRRSVQIDQSPMQSPSQGPLQSGRFGSGSMSPGAAGVRSPALGMGGPSGNYDNFMRRASVTTGGEGGNTLPPLHERNDSTDASGEGAGSLKRKGSALEESNTAGYGANAPLRPGNNFPGQQHSPFSFPSSSSPSSPMHGIGGPDAGPAPKRKTSAFDAASFLYNPSLAGGLADGRRDSTDSLTRGFAGLGDRRPSLAQQGHNFDQNQQGQHSNQYGGYQQHQQQHGQPTQGGDRSGSRDTAVDRPEGAKQEDRPPIPTVSAPEGEGGNANQSGSASQPTSTNGVPRSPSGDQGSSATSAGPGAAGQAAEESGSDSGQGGLAPPERKETPYSRSPELRVSHKLAERKRRREMKDLFDDLRDALPVDRGPKTSKWEILSKAVDYIASIKQQHTDMQREIEGLRHELGSYRAATGGAPPQGGPPPHLTPGHQRSHSQAPHASAQQPQFSAAQAQVQAAAAAVGWQPGHGAPLQNIGQGMGQGMNIPPQMGMGYPHMGQGGMPGSMGGR